MKEGASESERARAQYARQSAREQQNERASERERPILFLSGISDASIGGAILQETLDHFLRIDKIHALFTPQTSNYAIVVQSEFMVTFMRICVCVKNVCVCVRECDIPSAALLSSLRSGCLFRRGLTCTQNGQVPSKVKPCIGGMLPPTILNFTSRSIYSSKITFHSSLYSA